MSVLLVTGSNGLVGSECVRYFDAKGWEVHGVDNNLRRDFFGPDGDTSWNLRLLQSQTRHFRHHGLDIRDRQAVLDLTAQVRPDFVIHCAAQPSHDLAAKRPFDDFDVNALGTINLLEATRQHAPEAVFCFMSTNKVYGDAPNELPLAELPTRWDYARPQDHDGIAETMRIDQSMHSVFGADKTAADILVQEYGRYFAMKTGCFRGGCLTGPAHSSAELHGFLAYLVKCCRQGRPYRVFGYKGKQVRDNLHAYDVCRAFEEFFNAPRPGEVYNLGGGRANSVSVLEAIRMVEEAVGKPLSWEYVDSARAGDHICYISNLAKLKSHFPAWAVTRSLTSIIEELARSPVSTTTS
jgi:CDP-paratose 2-epimerase